MAQPLAPRRGARGSPGAAAAAAAAHCRSDKLPPADACAPQAFLVITCARGSDAGVWEAVPSRVCVCPAGSPASHRARPRPHWARTMRSGCLHRVCQVRRARRGRARRGGGGGAVPGGAVPGGALARGGRRSCESVWQLKIIGKRPRSAPAGTQRPSPAAASASPKAVRSIWRRQLRGPRGGGDGSDAPAATCVSPNGHFIS